MATEPKIIKIYLYTDAPVFVFTQSDFTLFICNVYKCGISIYYTEGTPKRTHTSITSKRA